MSFSTINSQACCISCIQLPVFLSCLSCQRCPSRFACRKWTIWQSWIKRKPLLSPSQFWLLCIPGPFSIALLGFWLNTAMWLGHLVTKKISGRVLPTASEMQVLEQWEAQEQRLPVRISALPPGNRKSSLHIQGPPWPDCYLTPGVDRGVVNFCWAVTKLQGLFTSCPWPTSPNSHLSP